MNRALAALAAPLVLVLAGCGSADGSGKGTIPFPAGYALMPGDAARWAAMTERQQRRALAFISTGSTIQSSQHPD